MPFFGCFNGNKLRSHGAVREPARDLFFKHRRFARTAFAGNHQHAAMPCLAAGNHKSGERAMGLGLREAVQIEAGRGR